MNTDTIIRLLQNAGFHGVRANSDFVFIEDPSCILRSFETFAGYAWTIIAILTGMMLFGWAISMLRGAKNDFFMNLRNLILIFGLLTLARPIMNFVYGGDLFGLGCKTFSIPMSEIELLLESRNLNLNTADGMYEDLQIYDSGVIER